MLEAPNDVDLDIIRMHRYHYKKQRATSLSLLYKGLPKLWKIDATSKTLRYVFPQVLQFIDYYAFCCLFHRLYQFDRIDDNKPISH